MPRQIRFRVWNPTEKKMTYPEPASLTCAIGLDGCLFNAEELMPLDGAILMLSTGLTDKNGREIFEGDLIRWVWMNHDHWQESTDIVEWDDLDAGFSFFHDDSEYGREIEAEHAMVIGNIYEHPNVSHGANGARRLGPLLTTRERIPTPRPEPSPLAENV